MVLKGFRLVTEKVNYRRWCTESITGLHSRVSLFILISFLAHNLSSTHTQLHKYTPRWFETSCLIPFPDPKITLLSRVGLGLLKSYTVRQYKHTQWNNRCRWSPAICFVPIRSLLLSLLFSIIWSYYLKLFKPPMQYVSLLAPLWLAVCPLFSCWRHVTPMTGCEKLITTRVVNPR